MEVALVSMAAPLVPDEAPKVDEIPFDSDRKRLVTVHRTGDGLVLYAKGALEMLLPACGWVSQIGGPPPAHSRGRDGVPRRADDDGAERLAGPGLRPSRAARWLRSHTPRRRPRARWAGRSRGSAATRGAGGHRALPPRRYPRRDGDRRPSRRPRSPSAARSVCSPARIRSSSPAIACDACPTRRCGPHSRRRTSCSPGSRPTRSCAS